MTMQTNRAPGPGIGRLAPAVGLTVFLVLTGAGVATASWTASPVKTTASVASGTIGIAQAGFDQLAVTYSTALTSVTKPITVTNTGTISAGYTLTLGAVSPTALSAAVRVKIWPVASALASDCSASTPLPLMADWTWATVPPLRGTLAASASAFYCVRTSVSTVPPTPADGRAMVATLALRSAVGAWSAGASATAAQAMLDTTPPTAPASLSASATSDSQTTLAWSPSTDIGGVRDYDVYRDGVAVKTSTSSPYTDTGLSVGKTYTYAVVAHDLSGNASAASAVSVTTLGVDSAKWYTVANPASGLCVAATGAAAGSAVTAQGCAGGTSQAWQFAASGSKYKAVPRSAPTFVVGTSSGGSGKGGAQLATDSGVAALKWQIVALTAGTGNFHVVNVKSSDCLDMASAPAVGTQLLISACGTSASQIFTMTAVP